MLPAIRIGHDVAAIQQDHLGDSGDDRTGHDAGHLALGRPGGSYRTVQRFFYTAVDWSQVHWLLIQTHLLQPQATYLLVGDEVVVTKAGHETHGLDRFFSSLFGKPVPGLAFFAFALVNVQQRTAHPLRIGQVLRPEPVAVPVAPAPAAPVAKRGRGRPKGSKNRNKADVTLAPYLSFILTLLQAVKQVLGTTLTVTYVVLDGAFGNNYALQMVRRGGYDLISKLAVNSALHFRYAGTYSGRGPHKKYGERVKYGALPGEYRPDHDRERHLHRDLPVHGPAPAVCPAAQRRGHRQDEQ